MKILWFNWRDIRNKDAGGAEVFTHEVMRRLADRGHSLTLFTSEFPGCLSEETIDGTNILRRGNKYTVYRKAVEYYKKNGHAFDLVIDEVNTRPFLTPKFVLGKPILAIIHQLAKEFWFYETSFPLNYIGYHYLEKKWLSYYVNIPTMTVSESSRMDLLELGFKKIHIVPEGLNVSPLAHPPNKETYPTVIFTGRLKRAKLPHHAVRAFELIKKAIPEARMWIVGSGYMKEKLERMNSQDITFYGRLSEQEKYDLMKRAHIALVPAVREGWGLVVTEANAMGTPAVAYNVNGLRDSVKDNETGVLAQDNTPEALAEAAIKLLEDKEQLSKLSHNALEFSRQFSWDNTTDAFEKIIRTLTAETLQPDGSFR